MLADVPPQRTEIYNNPDISKIVATLKGAQEGILKFDLPLTDLPKVTIDNVVGKLDESGFNIGNAMTFSNGYKKSNDGLSLPKTISESFVKQNEFADSNGNFIIFEKGKGGAITSITYRTSYGKEMHFLSGATDKSGILMSDVNKTLDYIMRYNGLSENSKNALENISFPNHERIIGFVKSIKLSITIAQDRNIKLPVNEEKKLRALIYLIYNGAGKNAFIGEIFKDITGIDSGIYDVNIDGDIFRSYGSNSKSSCPCEFLFGTEDPWTNPPETTLEELLSGEMKLDLTKKAIKY